MISAEAIRAKISVRAKRQFVRDMKQIQEMIQNNGGSISILEAIEISKNAELKELKLQKKSIFNFFSRQIVNVIDDEGYIPEFVLKFMAKLEVEELSLDEFNELKFGEIYLTHYKKEYEAYQEHLFNVIDMKYFNSGIIRCNNPNTKSAEVENCGE